MSKALHLWLSGPFGVARAKLHPILNFHRRLLADFRESVTRSPTFPAWRVRALFGRIRRRPNDSSRPEADTIDLIARFGDQAYYEAEQLSKGYGVMDDGRSRLHWARVKIEIARRHKIDIGLSGAVRWE
jgi:hypothetical protein